MSKKVKNERYYLSEIHRHSEKISKELKRLRTQINELKSSAALREKALNQLNQLEAEKEELTRSTQKNRFILTILSNKSRLDDVANEIVEKRSENKDLLIRLEDIYNSRKNKEQNVEALRNNIQQEESQLERELQRLPENERQEYYKKLQMLESIKHEITRIENSLVENNSKADFYFEKMDHPMKKSLFNLISEYEILKDERDNLANILRNKGSIKFEEDSLLQAIREARLQLQQLEQENKVYQQKMEAIQEVIEGLDKDLKEGYSARHGKYLELMKREQKMTQFIESSTEKVANYKRMMDAAGDAISEGLNFWSLHLGETDQSDFDTDDLQTAKQEYQMQITRLENIKERINSVRKETDDLRAEKIELEKEIFEQDDPEEVKETLAATIAEFQAERELLGKKIAATASAIEVAFKNNKEMTDKLARNKNYGEIKVLEEKLNDFEKKRAEYHGRIGVLSKLMNNEQLANDVFDLLKKYNSLLIDKY